VGTTQVGQRTGCGEQLERWCKAFLCQPACRATRLLCTRTAVAIKAASFLVPHLRLVAADGAHMEAHEQARLAGLQADGRTEG